MQLWINSTKVDLVSIILQLSLYILLKKSLPIHETEQFLSTMVYTKSYVKQKCHSFYNKNNDAVLPLTQCSPHKWSALCYKYFKKVINLFSTDTAFNISSQPTQQARR